MGQPFYRWLRRATFERSKVSHVLVSSPVHHIQEWPGIGSRYQS